MFCHVVLFSHSVLEKIYGQLLSKDYKDAVELMSVAKETFPEVAMEKHHTEEDSEETEEPVTMDTLQCLKHLFMGG